MRASAKALIILAIITVTGQNAVANRYFRIVTDSVRNYTYDQNINGYKLASISYYHYREGILDSIISTSPGEYPFQRPIFSFRRSSDRSADLCCAQRVWYRAESGMSYDDQAGW
jgi:hypothetical protein